jgi:hypothetical protein
MNKTYKQDEVMDLLYDLGAHSELTETNDKFGISSQIHQIDKPIYEFNTTIINVLIPAAFNGLLPI